MRLLNDEDLIANIRAAPPAVSYVAGVRLPTDPYSSDSPVQASSIDLHIGRIYLPGKKEDAIGGTRNPRSDYVLQTGETAVVTTIETLHIPSNVAGIGFPPSTVSGRGLLMTNPGHVDPGYEGVLRFTVINMAKENFPLNVGDSIVTLLLFVMDDDVHADWAQRNPRGSGPPSQANINRLSKDFVDVERRAKKIAKTQGAWWGLAITVTVALVAALLQAVSSGHLFYRADVEDLKKRQEIVEYDLKNRVNVERKLQDFDNRLKGLERAQSKVTTGQAKAQSQVKTSSKGSAKRH